MSGTGGTNRGNRGRPHNPDGWWYRATDAQRLRQIDAGIELGMTVRQVALASGAHASGLRTFATRHQRVFKGGDGQAVRLAAIARGRRMIAAKAAFERGEAINMWSDEVPSHRRDLTTDELVLE